LEKEWNSIRETAEETAGEKSRKFFEDNFENGIGNEIHP
jgi:hypothetical protein